MNKIEDIEAVKKQINKLNRLILDFYDNEKKKEECHKKIEKILKKIYKVIIVILILVFLSFGK